MQGTKLTDIVFWRFEKIGLTRKKTREFASCKWQSALNEAEAQSQLSGSRLTSVSLKCDMVWLTVDSAGSAPSQVWGGPSPH